MSGTNANQKIWYVKVDNQHIGPFSLEELGQKLAKGEFNPQQVARHSNTSQWQPLSEVIGHTQPTPPSSDMSTQKRSQEDLSALIHLSPNPIDATKQLDMNAIRQATEEEKKVQKQAPKDKRVWVIAMVKTLAFVALVLAGVASYLAYQKFFPAYPSLADVSENDYKLLKSSARASSSDGAVAAFALSNQSIEKPTFYIAANLEGGAEVELSLAPVVATLLQPSFETIRESAKVYKHFASIASIQLPNAQPLPMGEYQIELTLSSDKKLLFTNRLFLGGAKDSTYIENLKNRHAQLRKEYIDKLSVARPYIVKLEELFQSTMTAKETAQKRPVPRVRLAAWKGFHDKWISKENEFNQNLANEKSKETVVAIQELFGLISDAAVLVHQTHGLHHSFFTEKQDLALFKIHLDEQANKTKLAIEDLKQKFDDAEKTLRETEGFIQLKSVKPAPAESPAAAAQTQTNEPAATAPSAAPQVPSTEPTAVAPSAVPPTDSPTKEVPAKLQPPETETTQ